MRVKVQKNDNRSFVLKLASMEEGLHNIAHQEMRKNYCTRN